jgi:glycerol-3-phosphate dehydrogenase (NAD(P)+)
MRFTVLGAGSWGTALAKLVGDAGHDVALWMRSPDRARDLAERRENVKYLPGAKLPTSLAPTADLEAALADAKMILSVIPSHTVREVFQRAAPRIAKDAIVVSASKGIELETGATMADVLADVLGGVLGSGARIAVLSGPSFAKETARGLPTAVVVAAKDIKVAEDVQAAMATDRFRVYTSQDVIGVEIGGALKNVIAIAAGCADGLGFGHNTRAALITRGIAEIARLAERLGGQAPTLAGLAGLGDLVLTCTGDLSRNRTVGLELGRGRKLQEILEGMSQVAEGVRTTRSAFELAKKVGVEMPITEQIYEVLYRDVPPSQALAMLMTRKLKAEQG